MCFQVVFMFAVNAALTFFQLLAGGFAQPQCEADGQDVDDRQLQQPRHHRGVHFYVFLRSDTQHAVGKLRQRRIVTRYGDDRRTASRSSMEEPELDTATSTSLSVSTAAAISWVWVST